MVTPTLGADLLAAVARLNRLASQRARIPLPSAQGRLLSTIEDQGAARISDLATLDHCSQPTMTMQVRRLEDAG
ncbi:MAG TPA: MarR family transcriptional regulator, partial [Mycobacterium sp.]|nr:MarR family transcriptional regulator [Mycobacterium sp.]